MRGIVAAFEPIKIGRVQLGVGADTDLTFEFDLPRRTIVWDLPMIVTFLLVSLNDLHMRIELNGTVISDREYTNGAERSIQEIAEGISAAVGNRNTMTFTVLRGEVSFSDVALWYQRSVKAGHIIGGGPDLEIDFGGHITPDQVFADYKVIKIGRVRMSVGADIDRTFEFELPGLTRPAVPAIVTFLLVSSHDLHMRIEFDGTMISDRRYTNGPERSIQEIISEGISVPVDDRKTMTFTVLQGEVLFRGVVLWFSRDAKSADPFFPGT
jgi:hypothetical protein